MSDCIIEVKNLHKVYQNGVENLEVLKGIDLKIERGELLSIEGPSGAGKSTLLNIIGTLDRPSKGEVFFEGADVHKFNEAKTAAFRNKKVGFVFQFYHLLPEFTALENVMLPALMEGVLKKGEVQARAKKIFEQVGLSDRMHFMPRKLSGGEQQRVAIARALINAPDILLCDEPTGNLDSENGRNILSILKRLCRENQTTVALVTHDKEIAAISDRVIFMKDGRMLVHN